jgi:lysophospholipase L1-like esterase
MKAVVCCLAAALFASAQNPSALMSGTESNQLYARVLQLMESSTVAVPELNRAGAPLIENARQALVNLRQRPNQVAFTYAFLTNVRAYLTLSEAVPRPYPFPAEAGRQLVELRDATDRTEAHFRAAIAQREAQLRTGDRDNLARYAEANQKLPPPQPGKRRIVFLGDSITDFWRLNEYFPDSDFINRGISGQISGEMLGRFKADVVDLKPEAVLILAGTNDLARAVNIVAIENNLSMIADLADRHGIKLILASVLPVSDYHKDQNPSWERTRDRSPALILALNAWMKNLSVQRGYVYCDYFSAMVDNAGQLTADLADDGLHPNSKGYRIMAPIAQAAIARTAAPVVPVQQKQKGLRLFSKE